MHCLSHDEYALRVLGCLIIPETCCPRLPKSHAGWFLVAQRCESSFDTCLLQAVAAPAGQIHVIGHDPIMGDILFISTPHNIWMAQKVLYYQLLRLNSVQHLDGINMIFYLLVSMESSVGVYSCMGLWSGSRASATSWVMYAQR